MARTAIPLFACEGRAALRRALHGRLLLAFDFDGTLAPIVEHPDLARVPPDWVPLLAHLARCRPLAVVTGRRVTDVSTRLGFSPTHVVGNHGAEGLAPRPLAGGAALEPARARLHASREALQQAGVTVEDKGLSLALHYRMAPHPARARLAIERVLAGLGGVRRFGGKCVENVVDADLPDKGDAVLALAERELADAVIFAGDDVNDEAVFERAPRHWVTVRIGDDGRASAARFVLADQGQVRTLLRLLGRRVTF